MRKKICYLANAANYHTKKWCNYFAKKGYEIIVISLNPGEIEGIKVYSFDEKNLRTRSTISKISYLFKTKEIKKVLKKEKPDIVHAHYASSYGLLAAILNYHPYILSAWGSDVYLFPKKNIIQKYMIKYNFKKADYIWSTSKDMAREIKLYTNKDIHITPFGVDTSIFKPNRKIKNKRLIIGTVKALSKIYGINYLIRAFAILKEKYKDIELHIAGKGEQERELKQLCVDLGINNDVKFLGFLESPYLVAQTFNTFDIAVFPSLSESFGVAAIEAQACGVPVIVTKVGGLPEVVEENKTGLIIEKGNIEELVMAIEYLILNEEKRIEMGKSGRKFVLDNYDIENNFGSVDELYKNIIFKYK